MNVRRGLVIHPGYFRYAALSLEDLVRYAYAVNGYEPVVGGPDWAHAEMTGGTRFAIEATYPETIDAAAVPTMVQALLRDRFKLALHTQTIDASVYELRPGAKPIALTRFTPGDPIPNPPCPADMAGYPIVSNTRVGPVARFIEVLSKVYKLPVADKTGLSGEYIFSFCYPMPSQLAQPGLSPPLSIQAAIQEQLGFRLVAGKGKIRKFVIDHAEMPLAN